MISVLNTACIGIHMKDTQSTEGIEKFKEIILCILVWWIIMQSRMSILLFAE